LCKVIYRPLITELIRYRIIHKTPLTIDDIRRSVVKRLTSIDAAAAETGRMRIAAELVKTMTTDGGQFVELVERRLDTPLAVRLPSIQSQIGT